MSIYCWGSTMNGELGLGGIEDEQVFIHIKCLFRKRDLKYLKKKIVCLFFMI